MFEPFSRILPEKFSATVFVSNTLIDYDLQHAPDDVIAGTCEKLWPSEEHRAVYLNHGQAAMAVIEFTVPTRSI